MDNGKMVVRMMVGKVVRMMVGMVVRMARIVVSIVMRMSVM